MLIDLKAHYLDMIVEAIEVRGNACLHRPGETQDRGAIYATRSQTDTQAEFAVQYDFDAERMALLVEFCDSRPRLGFAAPYIEGIGEFFPRFQRALAANRIEDKTPRQKVPTAARANYSNLPDERGLL